MRTEAEFPVDNGTTIAVSCEEGYVNTGSNVVTCNYVSIEYETKPTCERPGKHYNRVEMYRHIPSYILAPIFTFSL